MNRTRIAAAACVLCCVVPAFASATIYWSADGDFFRAAEDGTGLQSLPGQGTFFTLELLG